jgi:hypothetical protein
MVPIITTQIKGGLGNQLFIYAQARAMADRVNGVLIIDPSLFSIDKVYKRTFLLDKFSIRANQILLQKNDLKLILSRIRSKLFRNNRLITGRWLYEPEPAVFLPDIITWNGTKAKLNGFWQSEEYFKDDSLQILKDLTPLGGDSIEQSVLGHKIIMTENSVFLHIRSYREVPGRKDGSFALPITYFKNAIAATERLVPNPHFFLFSDDHEWVSERLNLPENLQLTVVDKNKSISDSPINDFHLMSLCRHGIVANSSFSWWSGWLCEQRNLLKGRKSLIICPANVANLNYYPKRWQKIELK